MVSLLLLNACRSDSKTPAGPGGGFVSLAVDGSAPDVARTRQFIAMASSTDGTTTDVTTSVTWTSSNQNVATVSSTGLVTGVSIGDVDIMARLGALSDTRHVVLAGPDLTDFQRDYIEALFLGGGPYIPTTGFICNRDRWIGYPRGTTIRVIVSTVVSLDKRAAIQNAADQIAEGTAGALTATVSLTDDPLPLPKQNELTSTTKDDPGTEGCANNRGCTIMSFTNVPGVLYSARAVQLPNVVPNNYSHDVIGHGVLGLCHIDGNAIGGFNRSLMSDGAGKPGDVISINLTEFDLAATRTVFGSGLNPGATRSDFARAGLVRPVAQLARRPHVPSLLSEP